MNGHHLSPVGEGILVKGGGHLNTGVGTSPGRRSRRLPSSCRSRPRPLPRWPRPCERRWRTGPLPSDNSARASRTRQIHIGDNHVALTGHFSTQALPIPEAPPVINAVFIKIKPYLPGIYRQPATRQSRPVTSWGMRQNGHKSDNQNGKNYALVNLGNFTSGAQCPLM